MKEGHIYIDDVIQPNQHLLVKQQLAKLGAVDKVVLHIQSPGGSVYGGYNTYHVLKSLGVPIKTIVEGEAQSMASFLAIAGDEVEIRNPSVFMMHMPSMEMGGDADDLQSGANELRNIEDFMIQAYADKAKKSPDEIREMMKKTTVLNAAQAVEIGFADKVTEPLKAVALGKQITMKITKEITDLFDRVAVMFTDASKKFGPIAMELKTKVGGQDAMIFVESEDGDFVNKPARIGDGPAPDGEYPLEDGRILVVEAGVVKEVKTAPAEEPTETPEQAEIKALKAQVAELTAKATSDAERATKAEALLQENVVMLGTIKTEFENLRTVTMGSKKPPSKGKEEPITKREPTNLEQFNAEAQEELLELPGMGWMKQYIKKN